MVSIAVSFLWQIRREQPIPTEARSDAMGGTGVAAGSYGSGALINPALLAKSKPEDDVTVILPSVGVQVTDEDNLQDEIDTINDKINHYKDVVDSLTPIEVITNPLGSINQFRGAAKDLADELDYLKGKTAHATAGAGIAVSIPNDVLSVAFMAKGYAHGRVSSSIDQQDIDYLRGIQRSDAVAAGVALDAALNGTDQITKNLNSTASGRAAIVSDYGIAVARQFDLGGVPVSVGVTPKLQKPGSITTPLQSTITTVISGTTAATVPTTLASTSMPVLLLISVKTGRSA